MLKPKRKITRDQIKNDSFVETIFDIRSYVMDNSKLLSRIGGGFVVLLLLIVFLGQSSKNNKREAEFLLTQSNVYLDNGDSQNAKIILQELVDEYGNTESGRLGGYHLAQLYLKNNEKESALSLLLKYSKKGENLFLLTSANEAISSLYQENNDIQNAIKYQSVAAENSYSKKKGVLSKLKLIELYIKDGSLDMSANLLNELKFEHKDDIDMMKNIDYVSGLLMNE
tara:strand:+ start:254 stop:931 length:678 start_codon:yes stop_codon:yes gene_type:complete